LREGSTLCLTTGAVVVRGNKGEGVGGKTDAAFVVGLRAEEGVEGSLPLTPPEGGETSGTGSLPFREGVGGGYAIQHGAGGVGVGFHEGFGSEQGGMDGLLITPIERGMTGIAARAGAQRQQDGHE